jgi:hypothetical protein
MSPPLATQLLSLLPLRGNRAAWLLRFFVRCADTRPRNAGVLARRCWQGQRAVERPPRPLLLLLLLRPLLLLPPPVLVLRAAAAAAAAARL